MTTWNNVTIRAVVPFDTLPDIEEFCLINEEGWDHAGASQSPLKNEDGSYQRDADGRVLYSERTADTFTYCAGESKYRRDEIGEWCIEWTKAHPGIAVEWSQTWDDDGQGETLDVYRDGELVRAESLTSRLTPLDMFKMVEDLRANLRAHDADPHADLRHFRANLDALLDALGPEVAR